MRACHGHRDPALRTSRLAGCALLLCLFGASVNATDGEIESVERLRDTTHAFLSGRLSLDGNADGETHIEVGQLDYRLRLKRCAHPPSAQLAPGGRTDGNTTVNLRCTEPARWSIFVPVRIERYTEVVVAERRLAHGQVIEPGDLRLERQSTSGLVAGYFTSPAAVIGQQARRAITPGQVLSSIHLAPRQVVERGQLVTLVAGASGLNVRMSGEALEGGAVGERVRVRNRSSKRIVEGVIERSGLVRVAF